MHSAHRRAHNKPHMVDAQLFREKPILRRHHILVTITRKFGVQSVTRFAGLAVADIVRDNDEILFRIEQLSLSKKYPGKSSTQKLLVVATGSVENQHGVCNDTVFILRRLAHSYIMNF